MFLVFIFVFKCVDLEMEAGESVFIVQKFPKINASDIFLPTEANETFFFPWCFFTIFSEQECNLLLIISPVLIQLNPVSERFSDS